MLDNKLWGVFQTSTRLQGDAYGRRVCMELTNARIKRATCFDEGGVTTQNHASYKCSGLAKFILVNPHLQTQPSKKVRSRHG